MAHVNPAYGIGAVAATGGFGPDDQRDLRPVDRLHRNIVGDHQPVEAGIARRSARSRVINAVVHPDDAARRRFNIIPFTHKPPEPDHKLEQKLKLREHFAAAGADLPFRLSAKASLEDFARYYRSRVSVLYDDRSALLRLRVEGFEPGDCKITFPDLDKDAWEDA